MSVSKIMWVEKYRPKKLSDIISQKEIIGSLSGLLKNQDEMPNLLFSGSAGVGKTTTAMCLCHEILGERWQDYTLELNASDERGIGMVREKVKKFSRFAGLDTEIPFKIIILNLTIKGLLRLRNTHLVILDMRLIYSKQLQVLVISLK